jgi:hypothetical protein
LQCKGEQKDCCVLKRGVGCCHGVVCEMCVCVCVQRLVAAARLVYTTVDVVSFSSQTIAFDVVLRFVLIAYLRAYCRRFRVVLRCCSRITSHNSLLRSPDQTKSCTIRSYTLRAVDCQVIRRFWPLAKAFTHFGNLFFCWTGASLAAFCRHFFFFFGVFIFYLVFELSFWKMPNFYSFDNEMSRWTPKVISVDIKPLNEPPKQ